MRENSFKCKNLRRVSDRLRPMELRFNKKLFERRKQTRNKLSRRINCVLIVVQLYRQFTVALSHLRKLLTETFLSPFDLFRFFIFPTRPDRTANWVWRLLCVFVAVISQSNANGKNDEGYIIRNACAWRWNCVSVKWTKWNEVRDYIDDAMTEKKCCLCVNKFLFH